MKDILLSFPGFENNRIFNIADQNGHEAAWRLLKKRFAEIGYNLKTVDQNSMSDCAGIIFIDEHSLISPAPEKRDIYGDAVRAGLIDRAALILYEGPSVRPKNYSKELHDKFPLIFTWRKELVDNKKFFKIHLPCPIKNTVIKDIGFNEKKLLVNISINKRSASPKELYGERKKSIGFFNDKIGSQFDLYGYRWNAPITRMEKIFPFLWRKYSSYKGVSDDKLTTLSNYKFSLCYENSRGLNGYITEKIFDCFIAKTVPIYWGAEDITDYVPKEAFIDRREFATDQELLDFLLKIDEMAYNRYLEAGKLFLGSDTFKLFSPEHFTDTILEKLKLPPITA